MVKFASAHGKRDRHQPVQPGACGTSSADILVEGFCGGGEMTPSIPTPRMIAKKQKEVFYVTGKACRAGHLCARYTSNAECVQCVSIKSAKRHIDDAPRIRARMDKWRLKNKKHVEEYASKYRKKFAAENPDKIRERSRQQYLRHKPKRRAYHKIWSAKNIEHLEEYREKYKSANIEVLRMRGRKNYEKNKPEILKKTKAKYAADPIRYKLGWIRRKYGLSGEQYDALSAVQKHACAICFVPFDPNKKRHKNVDHDHATGKVRGLLCGECNRMLGCAQDRPEVLANAAKYIIQHNTKTEVA